MKNNNKADFIKSITDHWTLFGVIVGVSEVVLAIIAYRVDGFNLTLLIILMGIVLFLPFGIALIDINNKFKLRRMKLRTEELIEEKNRLEEDLKKENKEKSILLKKNAELDEQVKNYYSRKKRVLSAIAQTQPASIEKTLRFFGEEGNMEEKKKVAAVVGQLIKVGRVESSSTSANSFVIVQK